MLDSTRHRRDLSLDEDGDEDGERVVRCAGCGREVARVCDRVTVGSGDLHTFVNPQGEVFELACFGRADGVTASGAPTLEFTWFPDHAWRYAGCRSCGMQLGWRFDGAASFWALDRRRLSWP